MSFSSLTSSAGPSLHTAKDGLAILPPSYAYLGSPLNEIRQCDRLWKGAQGLLISTLFHEASVLVQEASASFIPCIWGSVQGPQPSRMDCEQESSKSHECLSWKKQLESISTSSEESKPAAPHRAGLRPSQWSPLLPKNLSASEPQARLCPLSHQIYMTALGQRYHSFCPHWQRSKPRQRTMKWLS